MKYQLTSNQLEAVQRDLWKQALYYTNDKNTAKDLVQETIYKALAKIHLYTPNTSFKAWTSTILRNTFINSYRKRKKYRISDIDSSYEALMKNQEYNSGEYVLFRSEVYKLLQDLNPEERAVINLCKEGYSYKAIADELQIPLGTVKSRIHLARKKLKKKFKTQMAIAS